MVVRWEAHYAAQQTGLNSVRDHMNNIMMALQVQDITAQQLASVNHLIESVRVRMAEIFERLRHDVEVEMDDLAELRASQSRFDPTARYNPHGDHQKRADQVMQVMQSGDGAALEAVPDPVETSEIDAMFRAPASLGAAPAVSEPAAAADIDALFASAPAASVVPVLNAAAGSGPVAADDIDALFSAAPTAPAPPPAFSEPASQDDIDALFG